jgi:tripartite-type tricarboxylate transporter receptor subunit TctC
MKKQFRLETYVVCLLLAASLLSFPYSASLQAQDFPTKPISLVIPFGTGGSSELTARTFIHLSPEVLGQPMIIQIKAGGGGTIGTEFVAQAKPDGYTLLLGHTNCNTILPVAEGRGRGPGEMAPVGRINMENNIYWVRADSPFKTVKDMIDWAKANPAKLSFGNTGTWSNTDFEWRWLEQKTGMTSRNVPYTGGGEAVIGLLGGHIQVAILSSTIGYSHMRAGKLRPLVVSGPKRKAEIPDVPSMKEEGYDTGLEGIWKGVLAPMGTPGPIIDKLALGFKKMTENKQAIANLKQLGDEFNYLGPDGFAKFWREDYQIYKEMAKMVKK